jgi:predicted GNAT family N-acyltransferase
MTAHDRLISQKAKWFARPQRAKHDLRDVDLSSLAKRLVVFTPRAEEIHSLVARATREMGGGASSQVVCGVARHNPDCIWAIGPRDQYTTDTRLATGYLAFLMLNADGMRRLFDGSLDATNPDLALITRQHEKPAGIYVWGVYGTGHAAGGVALALEKVWSRLYADVDLYARAVTIEGRQMLEAFGFKRGATFDTIFASDFYQYRRSRPDPRKNPIYDTYRPGAGGDDLSVTLAHSIEDIMRVIAIRGAVYMSEQKCPYREEFDGNDFSGSHLLGYVGEEPAGCLRIRNFADFAKLERLAVRSEFRHRGLGGHLMRAGIELCRAKGYQKIYGRAQKHLLDYYRALGFRPLPGGRELSFSGYDYVEIIFEADRNPQAIALGIDPYVLLRPEGQWHDSGIFDTQSSAAPIHALAQELSA